MLALALGAAAFAPGRDARAQAALPEGEDAVTQSVERARRGGTFTGLRVAAPEPDQPGLFDGVTLTPGPLRLGGNLGIEFRSQKTSGQGRTLTRLELANINAATYIYQPWFAQVRGSIGGLRSTSNSSGTPGSKSTSLTGDFGLSLFPVSRFPFDAYMSVTDSRASGEFTSSDYRNTRVGARQAYRTVDETTNYVARAERSTLSSDTFGRDTLDVFEAGMNRRLGVHQVELNGNYSENRGGANGVDSRLARASARHAYNPASNLSVESLASSNRNTVQSNAAPGSEFATRFNQLTTFGSWRPDEGEPLYQKDRPLVLTASGRLFELKNEANGAESASTSLNGSLGANYTLDPNTRLTGSATATRTSSAGSDTWFTSQAGSAIYTANPRPLGDFTYNWSATGSAANATATGQEATQTYSGQLAHGVTRGFAIDDTSLVSVLAGQSAAVAHDRAGNTLTVAHNAGTNWSSGNGSGGQTYLGLSASDARTVGATRSNFQLVNLQATRQNPLSNISYWTGNFTVQGTRQSTEGAAAGFNWTTFGSLSYLHQRAFGVPRLRFTATYTAAVQQLSSRSSGDIDAPREFTSSAAEARFDYAIGKLEMRLSARTAVVEHQRQQLIFFRAVRNF